MGDWRNRVTTGLLYGTHYLKDNRLLPKGFDKRTAAAQIAVVGQALTDPRFTGGSDTVTYSVPLAAGSRPTTIEVELLYEAIGYRWAHNFQPYVHADEPRRFLGYFDHHADAAATRIANARRAI